MSERITLFNEEKVSISKMILDDCNIILKPVKISVTKFAMGETDLFSHWKLEDMTNLQKLICKYTRWISTGKNLTLMDISDHIEDYIGLEIEFLQFNFLFFSQSQRITKRINGQILETKEIGKD